MPTITPSYDTTLAERRAHAAALADRLASRIALEGPGPEAFDLLRAATLERDGLDQQIAWRNREHGWVRPTQPAWVD